MLDIHYERHQMKNPALPFIFHTDFQFTQSTEMPNWHENTEILYCLSGEGSVKCDTTDLHMKKGDTIIINARQLHTVSSDTEVRYHCLIIANSFFKENGIDIESISFKQSFCDSEASRLIEKIAEIFANPSTYSVAEIRLAVLSYIVYLCKHFIDEHISEPQKISKSYAAILDAVEYISQNFDKKLSLEELSARAGFSRFHFARIFKENTGFSVIEHINAIRCDNAGFLLRETQKPISEIALECGFESPSYFAKSFSGVYGLLPSEYRKRYSRH